MTDLPSEIVIEQLRQRLSDVEYENVKLRTQLILWQNGLVEVGETSGAETESPGKEQPPPRKD